ncbi:MAG TPA: universal stress protein [Nitrososphaeraceae archaeon]|jgi:nucleotide-binding universal stress UspA family protein
MSIENPTFSRILVAVDGSELSLNAAERALDIARHFNANLYAITVTYIPESYHLKQEDIMDKSKNRESMTDAKIWLDNFMQAAKESNVILKTELINSHRPVDYVIMEYAEQEKIDLIVMGTRGSSGLKDLLVGSVTSSVVTYAHCPVMVVK